MKAIEYFQPEVQVYYLQEYMDILNTPAYGLSEIDLKRRNDRKSVIRQHIFSEVFAAFADQNAPVDDPQLELV